MQRALHGAAAIFCYEGDCLFAGLIQHLFDWHDRNVRLRVCSTYSVSIRTKQDIEQQNRYVPSVRIQASPGRQCRVDSCAIEAAHRREM
jgi:hypothetical protein